MLHEACLSDYDSFLDAGASKEHQRAKLFETAVSFFSDKPKSKSSELLPEIGVDELTGNVDKYNDFFNALEKTSPVPIAIEDITSG